MARRVDVRPIEVVEVIGYYSMLHRKPLGKYNVQVCTNISCMLRGADEIFEHACKKLGIKHKQTTPDGLFSLEEVECMGACCGAPAMQVNYDFYENLTPEKIDALIEELKKKEPKQRCEADHGKIAGLRWLSRYGATHGADQSHLPANN